MNPTDTLKWLFAQLDKQAHALGCAALYGALREVFLPLGWIFAVLLSLLIVIVVCWAKERYYDAARPLIHTKDWWDARAGLMGALVMLAWLDGVVPWVHWLLS